MRGKRWTEDDIQILHLNIETSEMARMLERTEASIYSKMFELRRQGKLPNSRSDRQIINEHRIIALANRLGVKLKGDTNE